MYRYFTVANSRRYVEVLQQLVDSDAQLIDAVKNGQTLRATGDNLDMTIRALDVTSTHKNRDLHYFATNMIVNRLEFPNLSKESPTKDLKRLNLTTFLLNDGELRNLRSNYMILVGRVLIEFLCSFSFLKSILSKHIDHRFSAQMAKKSTIVSMPILLHNEKEYSGVVYILRAYERWIAEIYGKADALKDQEQDIRELLDMVNGQQSDPDQPQSRRVHNDPNDPLRGSRVPVEGDQLTRVRLARARDLVAGNRTAVERCDHTTPYRSALWHAKASFLQVRILKL